MIEALANVRGSVSARIGLGLGSVLLAAGCGVRENGAEPIPATVVPPTPTATERITVTETVTASPSAEVAQPLFEFDYQNGGNPNITVYDSPAEGQTKSDVGYRTGRQVVILCKKLGRIVPTHPEVGENGVEGPGGKTPITSNEWYKVRGVPDLPEGAPEQEKYATATYGKVLNPQSVHIKNC